jgi:hypothetical protein
MAICLAKGGTLAQKTVSDRRKRTSGPQAFFARGADGSRGSARFLGDFGDFGSERYYELGRPQPSLQRQAGRNEVTG